MPEPSAGKRRRLSAAQGNRNLSLRTSSRATDMTRHIGRLLQIAGLALLPLAMVLELTDLLGPSFGVRDMLIMLVFGAAIFYLGRLLEGYSRPLGKDEGRGTKRPH